jgi:hypothetical protein
MMRITINQEKYEMKIPFSVEIVSLSLVASVFAGSALAEPKKTEREETRGAIAGLVVGAAVAGPIGAGVGAIMGGGCRTQKHDRDSDRQLEQPPITYSI